MGHTVLHGGILMVDSYDVTLHGNRVGKVQLSKQGLYYQLRCTCSAVDTDIYRLLGRCGQTQSRFGVLIPEGNRLTLETKIPVKKLNTDDLEFWLERTSAHARELPEKKSGFQYIPIYPDEPYTYLSKLKNSYFEIRNGKAGILIIE